MTLQIVIRGDTRKDVWDELLARKAAVMIQLQPSESPPPQLVRDGIVAKDAKEYPHQNERSGCRIIRRRDFYVLFLMNPALAEEWVEPGPEDLDAEGQDTRKAIDQINLGAETKIAPAEVVTLPTYESDPKDSEKSVKTDHDLNWKRIGKVLVFDEDRLPAGLDLVI